VYWFAGGVSDLANLIPLCENHHHLVHEGGWTLELFPDRTTVWRTPDGAVYHDGVTTDRRPGRQRQRCRVDTVKDIAAELELALADIVSGVPP
jgi:hypothetical protein